MSLFGRIIKSISKTVPQQNENRAPSAEVSSAQPAKKSPMSEEEKAKLRALFDQLDAASNKATPPSAQIKNPNSQGKNI